MDIGAVVWNLKYHRIDNTMIVRKVQGKRKDVTINNSQFVCYLPLDNEAWLAFQKYGRRNELLKLVQDRILDMREGHPHVLDVSQDSVMQDITGS